MPTLEIMKTHTVTVSADATLSEAVDLMDLYQVSSLPVTDSEGVLQGFLAESDVLRILLPTIAPASSNGLLENAATEASPVEIQTPFQSVASIPVRQVMQTPAIFVTEQGDTGEAARLLLSRNLKRLPVVSEKGRVVGVLNRIDVIQAFFEGTLS